MVSIKYCILVKVSFEIFLYALFYICFFFVFFFQAEDGIRDLTVTGVQTCALPIYNVGADRYNQALSERRAAAVQAWLVAHNVTAPIATRGSGESKPVVPNTNPDGKIGRASCRERV